MKRQFMRRDLHRQQSARRRKVVAKWRFARQTRNICYVVVLRGEKCTPVELTSCAVLGR